MKCLALMEIESRGLSFAVGPFDSIEAASKWADENESAAVTSGESFELVSPRAFAKLARQES